MMVGCRKLFSILCVRLVHDCCCRHSKPKHLLCVMRLLCVRSKRFVFTSISMLYVICGCRFVVSSACRPSAYNSLERFLCNISMSRRCVHYVFASSNYPRWPLQFCFVGRIRLFVVYRRCATRRVAIEPSETLKQKPLAGQTEQSSGRFSFVTPLLQTSPAPAAVADCSP